jgi:hypothetical protein
LAPSFTFNKGAWFVLPAGMSSSGGKTKRLETASGRIGAAYMAENAMDFHRNRTS